MEVERNKQIRDMFWRESRQNLGVGENLGMALTLLAGALSGWLSCEDFRRAAGEDGLDHRFRC